MVKRLVLISFLIATTFLLKINFELEASTPPKAKINRSKTLSPSFSNFLLQQTTLKQAVVSLKRSPQRISLLSSAESFEQKSQQKSKGRAFLQSLVFPGWGQYYAQSKSMTKVFVGSEALLLGTYVGFNVWSSWLEDDFRTFAVTHAKVDLNGKSAAYLVDIGNFDDITAYNQAQLRDRDVLDLYPRTSEFFWSWDSEENRRKYEDMRIRSDRAANRADLTLAAIFLNHLVSAIHSTLVVHRYNQRLAERDVGLRLDLDVNSLEKEVRVGLVKEF